MKRSQKHREAVSIYGQEVEALFGKGYGRRQGMDLASKDTQEGPVLPRAAAQEARESATISHHFLLMYHTKPRLPKNEEHCYVNFTGVIDKKKLPSQSTSTSEELGKEPPKILPKRTVPTQLRRPRGCFIWQH